jgi:hypothetical protein
MNSGAIWRYRGASRAQAPLGSLRSAALSSEQQPEWLLGAPTLVVEKALYEAADDDGHREAMIRAPRPQALELVGGQTNRQHGRRTAG